MEATIKDTINIVHMIVDWQRVVEHNSLGLSLLVCLTLMLLRLTAEADRRNCALCLLSLTASLYG